MFGQPWLGLDTILLLVSVWVFLLCTLKHILIDLREIESRERERGD